MRDRDGDVGELAEGACDGASTEGMPPVGDEVPEDDLARHLANAGNPQGAYGASLLDVMNAGEHELLAAWGLAVLDEAFPTSEVRARTETAREAGSVPRILDLGCGGGANLVRLRRRFGGHVQGLDHSPVSVEKSRATCAAALPAGSWEVTQGDVAALPFADASLDLVCAFETIYFWEDPEAALAEVARVLAPGGVAFVCDEAGGTPELPGWARPLHLYHADGLAALLAGAGLADVRTRTGGEGPVAGADVAPEPGWLCATAVRR